MTDWKKDVAGLQMDASTKAEFLQKIEQRVTNRQQTFVTTPYSEFLFHALKEPGIMTLFNSADIAVPDGIGVLWADYFLRQPFTVRGYYPKILQAWGQVVRTGAAILLTPSKLYQTFPEKIVGADLIWDLAELAATRNFSIYLLGGWGDTPMRVKTILEQNFPGIRIVGASNKSIDDESIVIDISAVKPDMLLVAFGPIRQEQWIATHLKDLPVSLAIGLGGTFDYVAGNRPLPPRWVRQVGLEWLYRLITQPSRVGRIFNAVPGLILSLVRYKVFMSLPYRQNASVVVLNAAQRVLILKRNPKNSYIRKQYGKRAHHLYGDYWQFPQGGVDDDEDLLAAAQRELFEETGLQGLKILGTSKFVNHYTWTNQKRNLLLNKRRFKGQAQHTVFFLHSGPEDAVQPDEREFIDYRWVPLSEFVEQLAIERQPYARDIQNELQNLILEKQAKN